MSACALIFSQIALPALLQFVHGHQNRVVDEAAKAEAARRLEPRREVAQDDGRPDKVVVRVAEVVSEHHPREAQRGQNEADAPREALGVGRLPVRLGLQQYRQKRANDAKRRDGR